MYISWAITIPALSPVTIVNKKASLILRRVVCTCHKGIQLFNRVETISVFMPFTTAFYLPFPLLVKHERVSVIFLGHCTGEIGSSALTNILISVSGSQADHVEFDLYTQFILVSSAVSVVNDESIAGLSACLLIRFSLGFATRVWVSLTEELYDIVRYGLCHG